MAKTPSPKGQHVIPRMHLQHFAGDIPAGQVWSYDSKNGRCWSAIPEETGVRTHFYSRTLADGSIDTSLETHLSQFETLASRGYQSLVKAGHLNDLNDRMYVSQFLALMFARTTSMRRIAGEMYGRMIQLDAYTHASNPHTFNRLLDKLEKDFGEHIDPEIRENLRQRFLDPSQLEITIGKAATFSALGIADELAPILYRMNWKVMATTSETLVTSDNPIVRYNDPRVSHPAYGDLGFANVTCQVSFPLTPNLLLLMAWSDLSEVSANLTDGQVRKMNKLRSLACEQYLYAHKKSDDIAELATKYADSRAAVDTLGFGPMKFGASKVSRR